MAFDSPQLASIKAHAEHIRVAFNAITGEIRRLPEELPDEDVGILKDIFTAGYKTRLEMSTRFDEYLTVREALKDLMVARTRRAGEP